MPTGCSQAKPGLTDWGCITPATNTSESPEQDAGPRFHHLDAARAFALLLGVFFHAAESFGPRNYYWAIVDCSPSGFLEWCRLACHSFRLELFFVIAGFFARLLLVRRGTGGFAWNRVQRILVPLVVGWALLYPLLVSLWLWGWSISGNLGDLVPPEARHLPIWQLTLGFFLTGEFVRKLDLTHLWFLHQLLVIYALMLAIRWLATQVDRSGTRMLRVDAWFARMIAWPGAILGFSLASTPILLLMSSWGVDTPKESLIPHLPTMLLFGFCFLAGWLWHRQPKLLEALIPRWHWHLAIGALLWVAVGIFANEKLFSGRTREQMQWMRLAYTVLYAQMMWAFILGFIGVFTRYCARASAWTRYVADASYWVYIVHLPLVVALQVMLGRVALPWPIKYPCICAVTLLVVFATYHYLVRGTFIGAQLNGRRYPQVWPWQR